MTKPFATVNWAKEIDKDGRPMPDPDKEPKRDGRLVAPNEGGATNYRSPSFDPAHRPARRQRGWTPTASTSSSRNTARMAGRARIQRMVARGDPRASTIKTGDMKWSHDIGEGGGSAGVLTTATGITFTGDYQQQPDRAAHQRRRHAVALGDRARRQLADRVRAGRASVPADRRRQLASTPSRFRSRPPRRRRRRRLPRHVDRSEVSEVEVSEVTALEHPPERVRRPPLLELAVCHLHGRYSTTSPTNHHA